MKRKHYTIILIVLLVALLIILYLITFGKVNFIQEGDSKNKSSDEKKKWLEHRHRKLEGLVNKKVGLIENLNRIVKTSYFLVRLFFVAVFVGINLLAFNSFNLTLENLLSYNQVFAVSFFGVCFLIYDKPSDIYTIFSSLRLSVENYVFQKYGNLEQQIEEHKKEMADINQEVSQLVEINIPPKVISDKDLLERLEIIVKKKST